MKARVYVTLKEGVLDPAGNAVASGLRTLGFSQVEDVRLGKFIEIDLGECADPEGAVRAMADKLLANPVMEDFRVELVKQ